MSVISNFAGVFNALNFAYGYQNAVALAPPALQVGSGNAAAGVSSITIITPITVTQGGSSFSPIAVGSTLIIGIGANAETITVTGVGTPSLAGYGPGTGSVTVTATFANVHGQNEPVTSATVGLQEAINIAATLGGGTVNISGMWWKTGGTLAMIQAATVPQIAAAALATPIGPIAATVRLLDETTLTYYEYKGNSVSILASPSTPTSATVASTSTTGTWTAVTTYVKFVYVNALGGLSPASSEYSFTATVSKAIGGTGPAALTGAVGYLVFIGTTTNVNYQVVVSTSSGTPIQCGAILAFQIGTSFSSTTITTVAAPLPPVLGTASATLAMQPVSAPNMIQPFQAVQGPFAAVATVTAGTAAEVARFDLPTAFLNQIGRTLRITAWLSYTPGSTATLIPSLLLESVYGTTTTTVWTVTTAATSGTTQTNAKIEILLSVAATGTSGTVECHGTMQYGSASGSAPAFLTVGDAVTAASGAANLAVQNTFSLQMNSGTANLTSVRVRSLVVEVLQ